MPQSLSNVMCHLVFSTKSRERLIEGEIEDSLHRYLATLVRDKDCECYRVGGVEDHVHLAIRLGRQVTQSDLVGEI